MLPARELEFLVFDWLDAGTLLTRARFSGHDLEQYQGVVDLARRIAASHFAPFSAELDETEPWVVDGRAVTPAPLKQAIRAYCDGGFIAAAFDVENGGSQLPHLIASACQMVFASVDNPAMGYAFLTAAAARLVSTFGDDAQRARYLPPMLEGRWLGTMCLSEPQAGSSLSEVRTSARLAPDGRWLIRGEKMWISGGDHDLSDTIIHMVLALVDGGPSGAGGLSLFIVPKHKLDEAGRVGPSNDVRLIGLNHKLGHRATTNCALRFGEDDDCEGVLLGRLHNGLPQMFQMMNEARVGVGAGAAVTAYAAYAYSADYASQRRQGRAPNVPTGVSSPIIEHPDVARMILRQKAFAEGGLALCLFGARLLDDAQSHPEADVRLKASRLLDALTPIIKSWPAERGIESNSLAIQVLGGAGYVRDHPVERWFRDQRLNAIHEGTTGIQAIGLLRGSPSSTAEVGLGLVFTEIRRDGETVSDPWGIAATILKALDAIEALHQRLTEEPDRRVALAAATPFLEIVGDLVVAWMWLLQAPAAARHDDVDYAAGKRAAARYFHRHFVGLIPSRCDVFPTAEDGVGDAGPAALLA